MLDANVLVPITLTDTLLHVAEQGMFEPLWSQRILDETLQALKVLHADKSNALEKRIAQMNFAFPQACVGGWEYLESGLAGLCPDPEDAHVVAAAILGRADVIVTSNLKDFPDSLLSPLGLQAVDPDDFLLDQLDLNVGLVLRGIEAQVSAMSRPAHAMDVLLERLRKFAPNFVSEVQTLME